RDGRVSWAGSLRRDSPGSPGDVAPGLRCPKAKGSPAAAEGAVPADPDGRPVQPPPPGVLRAAGRRRQAEDAGDRGVHAEAGDDRLRGAQEPRPVRPGLVVKNHPLTTRYLVRPHPRVWRFAYLLTAS